MRQQVAEGDSDELSRLRWPRAGSSHEQARRAGDSVFFPNKTKKKKKKKQKYKKK
jgi:hypothetical protein